jgi:hypothetical protein
MYLVALHPDNENYKKIKVVNLQPQVEALVAERKANIQKEKEKEN